MLCPLKQVLHILLVVLGNIPLLVFGCVKHMGTAVSTSLEKRLISIVRLTVDWFQVPSITCSLTLESVRGAYDVVKSLHQLVRRSLT